MGIHSLKDTYTPTSTGVGSKGRYRSDFGFDNSVLSNTFLNNNVADIGEAYQGFSVSDNTVVSSAYDTSGNGGRRITKLSNGWLVFVVSDTTNTDLYWYVSKDNMATTPTQLCKFTDNPKKDVSIVSKGTMVYTLVGIDNGTSDQISFFKFDATTQQNVDLSVVGTGIDTAQTDTGGVSLAINDTGTELHATWSSKNSSYPNSFNIRYAKGTINADGSVTWSAVVQVTTQNASSYDFKNPTIIYQNGHPTIFVEYSSGSYNRYIMTFTTKFTTIDTDLSSAYQNSSWGSKRVYFDFNGYIQSSPSAIFVPQSINGLAKGRIWVAWHGYDSTDTTQYNIRVSYSDDGGTTWSTMQKLTNGNTVTQVNPTITANKNNQIFVVFTGRPSTGEQPQIRKITNLNGVWGSVATITSNTTNGNNFASSLFDQSFALNFSEPIFIYQNSQLSKVGFYGTWSKGGIMSGTVTKTINPSDLQNWGNIQFSKTTPSGTSVVCDILDLDGNVLSANVSSLKELKDISNQPIQLRFTLSRTTNTDSTPTLSDVSITWEGDDTLRDETSGVNYKLVLSDGKLLLEEV